MMSALKLTGGICLFLLLLKALESSYPHVRAESQIVLEQPLITRGPNIVATMIRLTIPPGDIGTPPHTHSGPVTGYVLEGEFLFQVYNDTIKILKEGETFHVKDKDIHIWTANASNTTLCRVVATVWGRPGEPILTPVDNYSRISWEEALVIARLGP